MNMKNHLLVLLSLFFVVSCSSQETFKSKFLNTDEVKEFISKHPNLTHEDLINSDFTNVKNNAGISFVGISGLLFGSELDEAEFQKELDSIKRTYTYLFPLDKLNSEPLKSFCESDTIVPDVSTLLQYSYFKFDGASTMYLLKNQLGVFVDEMYLTYPYECENPSHGYSCGAVVDASTKRILYWVIFW